MECSGKEENMNQRTLSMIQELAKPGKFQDAGRPGGTVSGIPEDNT